MNRLLSFSILLLVTCSTFAAEPEQGFRCTQIQDPIDRLSCYDSVFLKPETVEVASHLSVLENRELSEREVRDNWFSITPHRPNYILPATYNESSDFSNYGTIGDLFSDTEIKFQLSLKTLLFENLWKDSSLTAAYTQQSFWQLYADDEISAPFRETNYEPEIIWSFPLDYEILGFKARELSFSFVHQSNGRSRPLSRSWNRVSSQLLLDRGNLAVLAKVWSRTDEPDLDDNPNIEEFMGRAQFGVAYRYHDHTFVMNVKNSLGSDYRSGVELNWLFPLSHHLKGFVQIYSGYGENLIDMEDKSNRIGIGVALTDWL